MALTLALRAARNMATDYLDGEEWAREVLGPILDPLPLTLDMSLPYDPNEDDEDDDSPEYYFPDDFDFGTVEEALLGDSDLDIVLSFPGAEHPQHPVNQHCHAGDLRPHTWFLTFANATPRDPFRPLRGLD